MSERMMHDQQSGWRCDEALSGDTHQCSFRFMHIDGWRRLHRKSIDHERTHREATTEWAAGCLSSASAYAQIDFALGIRGLVCLSRGECNLSNRLQPSDPLRSMWIPSHTGALDNPTLFCGSYNIGLILRDRLISHEWVVVPFPPPRKVLRRILDDTLQQSCNNSWCALLDIKSAELRFNPPDRSHLLMSK